MDNKIKKQLKQTSSQISFNELKVEILSEVIFIVSENLVLLEVAEACANDDKESFSFWIKDNLIRKPTSDEIILWKENNTIFECCIVKPFILLFSSKT